MGRRRSVGRRRSEGHFKQEEVRRTFGRHMSGYAQTFLGDELRFSMHILPNTSQGMMGALVIVLLFGGVLNGLSPSLGQIKRQHQWYLEVRAADAGIMPCKRSRPAEKGL